MSQDYWKEQYLQLLDEIGKLFAKYGNEKERQIGEKLKENGEKLKEMSEDKCKSK